LNDEIKKIEKKKRIESIGLTRQTFNLNRETIIIS